MQQLTESFHMTQQAAIHASKMKNLTRRAQKMLGFLDFAQDATCRHLTPFRAALDLPWATTEAAIDWPVLPHPAGASAPSLQDIATEDWDVLFRAIEERLGAMVADKPGAPLALFTHETAARNKVVVLECISAMEQLHTALTHERQCGQQPCACSD